MIEDRGPDALEVGPGLDPDLFDQQPTSAIELRQRLVLASAEVQRPHQPAAGALVERVGRSDAAGRARRIVEPAEPEERVHAHRLGAAAKLGERQEVVRNPGLIGNVGPWLAAPRSGRDLDESQRLVRIGRDRLRSLTDESLEPATVERIVVQHEPVAGAVADDDRPVLARDALRLEHPAQPTDEHLQRGAGGRRQVITPQPVDQQIVGDDPPGVDRQRREQAGELATGLHDDATDLGANRPENIDPDRCSHPFRVLPAWSAPNRQLVTSTGVPIGRIWKRSRMSAGAPASARSIPSRPSEKCDHPS